MLAPDRKRFFRLFSAVMLPMFLAAVDQTLLATATPVISRDLGGLEDSSWLAAAYLLTSVVTVPVYGLWGDRLGRRRLLLVAIAVFAVGSLACGAATTLGLLIAARVFQGLGGGGLMTLSQALIGEVVAPQQRARTQGYFVVIFTLASVGGPVIGGLIVHHANWRWLFLINLPLCALAYWRLRGLLGDDVPHPQHGGHDHAGLALFTVAMGATLYWLSAVGHRFSWSSGTGLTLLVVAALGWGVLLRVESRSASPFLPLDLLRLPAVRYAALTVLGFACAMFAMVFYLPVYLQLALHSTPAESGLYLLPLTLGVVSGAMLTGRLVLWTGRPTVLPIVGLLLASASLLGLVFVPEADMRLLMLLCASTGIGLGSVMSVMQVVTQIAAGPARLGVAAATMSLSRTLGSTLGASVFGAIIYGQVDGRNALAMAGSAQMQGELRHAFEWAFGGAAALCLLAAFTASRVPALRFSDLQMGRKAGGPTAGERDALVGSGPASASGPDDATLSAEAPQAAQR